MKQKYFFKATTNRQSWAYTSRFSPYNLHYAVGNKTVPKIGKIFVFADPQTLVDFVEKKMIVKIESIIIFAGKGKNPRAIHALPNYPREDFWKYKLSHKKIPSTMLTIPAPAGTVAIDDFTPTSEYSFDEFKKRYEVKPKGKIHG